MYKGCAISLSILVLFMFSCASPQKSFNKGDYDKAYKLALKNLKKGKKSRKDQTILNKSFEEMLDRERSEYAEYTRSDIIEDWEVAYSSYDDLLDTYEDGKRYLDSGFDINMEGIYAEIENLRKDIAGSFYELAQMGMEAYEDTEDKLEAQQAYYLYTKAEEYGSNEANIRERKAYALSEGVVTLLVIADERWGRTFAYDIDREFRNVEREGDDFLQIQYERNVEADCTIEVEFADIDRRVRDSRSTRTYREEIQDGFETRQDTSGNSTQVPRYITVSADVTTISEQITFEWEARTNIYGDSRYCNDYRERTFRADETLTNEIYEINGDTRAVPDGLRNSRNDNRREEDLIRDLLEELYDDFERAYF